VICTQKSNQQLKKYSGGNIMGILIVQHAALVRQELPHMLHFEKVSC